MEGFQLKCHDHLRPGLVLLLVSVAYFMLMADDTIVNVALPSIRHDLGFSESGLSWVTNAYFLAFGGFVLVGGRAADLFGRRRMFAASLGLFVAASATSAGATSGAVLVAARGVQGLAGALLSPSALSILLTTFTGQRERNRALGVWAGLTGLGAATGLLLGGSLIELLSWRWVFLINVPVGLIALAAAPIVISRRDHRKRVAADFAGAALITAALLLLVFTIVETGHQGWGSARTVLGLAGSAVLGIVFVLRQRAATEPLVPGALLRMRNVVTADALAFVAASGLFAMFFFLTLYMQTVQHWSALRTGLSYLPFSLTIFATSGVLSRVSDQRTSRPLFVAGPLLAATGLWLMSHLQPGSPYATALLPALLVTALGLGLIFVPLLNAATAGVADHDSGLASGLVTTSQQVGAAIAIAILVTIASHQTHQQLLAGAPPAQALVDGFHTAFVIQAIVLAASALVGAAITNPRHLRESAPPSARASRDHTTSNAGSRTQRRTATDHR
ncbi:MAG TPA: MFS transporter [Streptosporangiaceae bacterium]